MKITPDFRRTLINTAFEAFIFCSYVDIPMKNTNIGVDKAPKKCGHFVAN
jgi:hypothetical protein